MDYRDFACPNCKHHPLENEGSRLHCHSCGALYPIQQSVPLLFPREAPSVLVNRRKITLSEVMEVYDRAYNHAGLMGTELDEGYDRHTKKVLLDFAQPLDGKRVLDLGAGVGRLWEYVTGEVKGYAIEPSIVGATKVVERKKGLTVSASVGEAIPFMEDFFDAVIAADTVEHTFSPQQTIGEIWRVLKPKGILAASFPVPNSLSRWGRNQLVLRNYSPLFMVRLLWILVKRVLIFRKAAFQPIDRDMEAQEWVSLLERSGFAVRRLVEWPDAPQLPIVYLVHAEKS